MKPKFTSMYIYVHINYIHIYVHMYIWPNACSYHPLICERVTIWPTFAMNS